MLIYIHTPTERWNWSGNFQQQLCLCFKIPKDTHMAAPNAKSPPRGQVCTRSDSCWAVAAVPSSDRGMVPTRRAKAALHHRVCADRSAPSRAQDTGLRLFTRSWATCKHPATLKPSLQGAWTLKLQVASPIFPSSDLQESLVLLKEIIQAGSTTSPPFSSSFVLLSWNALPKLAQKVYHKNHFYLLQNNIDNEISRCIVKHYDESKTTSPKGLKYHLWDEGTYFSNSSTSVSHSRVFTLNHLLLAA